MDKAIWAGGEAGVPGSGSQSWRAVYVGSNSSEVCRAWMQTTLVGWDRARAEDHMTLRSQQLSVTADDTHVETHLTTGKRVTLGWPFWPVSELTQRRQCSDLKPDH